MVTETSDERAFLRAIARNPADNLARLAYCDWLEELGTEEGRTRARYVRLALAYRDGVRDGRYACAGDDQNWKHGWHYNTPRACPGCREHFKDTTELTGLFYTVTGRGPCGIDSQDMVGHSRTVGFDRFEVERSRSGHEPAAVLHLLWRGGFVSEIGAPEFQYVCLSAASCRAIADYHPVARVRLADKEPLRVSSTCYEWRCDGVVHAPHHLRYEIADNMTDPSVIRPGVYSSFTRLWTYPERELAVDAVEAAALKWLQSHRSKDE